MALQCSVLRTCRNHIMSSDTSICIFKSYYLLRDLGIVWILKAFAQYIIDFVSSHLGSDLLVVQTTEAIAKPSQTNVINHYPSMMVCKCMSLHKQPFCRLQHSALSGSHGHKCNSIATPCLDISLPNHQMAHSLKFFNHFFGCSFPVCSL